jgi:hypothetical protein
MPAASFHKCGDLEQLFFRFNRARPGDDYRITPAYPDVPDLKTTLDSGRPNQGQVL